MTNNVVISIEGTQDNSDPIAFMTNGTYCDQSGKVVLEYDDAGLEGLAGCRSMITFAGELVTMQRKGSVESTMYFEPKKWATTSIRLPEGALDMEIYSTRVDYEVAPEKGYLELSYLLKIGTHRAQNHIQVQYKALG